MAFFYDVRQQKMMLVGRQRKELLRAAKEEKLSILTYSLYELYILQYFTT